MSLLSRARPAHLSIHPHTSASVQTIRYRSAIPARKHFERIESRGRDQSQNRSRNSGAPKRPAWKPAPLKLVIHPPPTLDLAIIPTTLASLSKNWVKLSHVRQRLIRFGIPLKHVAPLLSAFSSALHNGTVLSSLDYEEDYLTRLSRDLGEVTNNAQRTDITLSRLFFEWAASSTGEQALLATNAVPPETISMIQTLFKAADLSNPSAFYPLTRAWPKRKVIMHVGPTNSGKTHNALRALAAAKTGVYAGPLRLLAHEIWERLNKGQIVPLGMDPEEDAEPDLENNIDGGTPFDINTPNPSHSKPIIQKTGNSKFARVCNLVTGEEQKILDELCGLYSCTIEMISFSSMVDVAVIDEIQMISDSERGGSWTSALLGLNAKEVHVCGEESAVPLVQSILKDTGDEIIVHRHERLSPLSLQETSLGGELSNVRKGDCVVAFSRSEIFKAKSVIEQKTGLKCAVAYGRLPPEIRSEQARLFNDPDSGFDIIVGSDAIGMGLNLKIKRIIFKAVKKFDGACERYLSISQFKQIAGRAGRYGLHTSTPSSPDSPPPSPESLGGYATTLHEDDLPILSKAIDAPTQPLNIARLRPPSEFATVVFEALPPSCHSRTSTLFEVLQYVSKMGKDYEVEDASKRAEAVDFIDTLVNETSSAIHTDRTIGGLSYKDKELLQLAPVPWRDPVTVEGVAKLMRTYRDELAVPLKDVLSIGGLWDHFEDMSSLMQTSRGDHSMDMSEDALIKLESLHKITIVYLWLSYRNPVAFSQRDEAVRIKERLEKVMEWTLQRITTRDDKRPANRREPLKFGPGENVKKSFDPRTGSNERRPFNKKSWTETSERKPSKFIKEESKVSNSFKGTLKLKHTPPSTSS